MPESKPCQQAFPRQLFEIVMPAEFHPCQSRQNSTQMSCMSYTATAIGRNDGKKQRDGSRNPKKDIGTDRQDKVPSNFRGRFQSAKYREDSHHSCRSSKHERNE